MANNIPDTDLNFRPLSDGLGFHPFSDGLPYAPTQKTPPPRASYGSGAVSAGRPIFIHSPTSAPKPLVATPVQVVATPAPTFALESLRSTDTSYGFGYLAKRVIAYGLDTAFNLAICLGALSTVLFKKDFSRETLTNPGILILAVLFLAFCNWGITTAQEVGFGTSLGKRVFGLSLRGTGMAAFMRALYFIPSICFAGIGLIWSVFDSKKRCWHDIASGLQPDEIAHL